MNQLNLIETDEERRFKEAEAFAKKYPTGPEGKIIKFFIAVRGDWWNKIDLSRVFTGQTNRYGYQFFAGLNWDRRLREVRARGWIEHEQDPEAGNKTFRYRMP